MRMRSCSGASPIGTRAAASSRSRAAARRGSFSFGRVNGSSFCKHGASEKSSRYTPTMLASAALTSGPSHIAALASV